MATVKGSRQIVLKDGTNYVDISNLPEAQYLRIVTDFAAEVGPDGTFVPELLSYQGVAENERDFTDMFWSTRPDWERGRFTGAAGFPPVGRPPVRALAILRKSGVMHPFKSIDQSVRLGRCWFRRPKV